ncbi:Uma2 family endonuclease [Fibrella aquatilis]|uniref:Uma2 family endonuclease n=1 Tax=Fibrella aquatilis TaxID=2817059 RepID=A0A939K221_9BACT|nr:Uma2 family endonuclease [Fibrella aquatilis]MBO0932845.1 Uma2 family endonuclease [Fibrella aquatilis]
MTVLNKPTRTARRPHPELIYEQWGGRTYYRKGYTDVVKKRKTPAEIMGSSGLQAFIVSFINGFLFSQIDRKKYRMLTSEPGLHLGPNENLACDVMIYDRDVLTNDRINVKCVDVPPLVAIEVDVRVELQTEGEISYVFRKTGQLFAFGVQRVVWVVSDLKQVLVFEKGIDAVEYKEWHQPIEIIPGVAINIGAYLDEEGITTSA